ncbi:MAG TPA: DUF1385 domain-containing protein [Anaerolineales bacterium]|nr:DUF1385 domain-containing protein [Anaerolineales bacterium]
MSKNAKNRESKRRLRRAATKPEQKIPLYGGQAVLEGVMMRGRRYMALAMRAPNGKIVLHSEKLGPIYQSQVARIPFLRGLVLLWDALALGTRALTISANIQSGEDQKIEGAPLAITLVFSLVFAIGLFFLAPAGISHFIEGWLGLPSIWGSILEGFIRLGVLIGYLILVGRVEEIRRVFGYHGAEHKTIHAFESAAKLTSREVDKFPRQHPRCGTAFLLTVVVFSILLFALIGPMPLLPRLVLRILLIPILASLAYEYLRWSAAHFNNPIVRILVSPNLALQDLTTRPPDKGMLEVGIAAFKQMKRLEEKAEN